MASSSANTNHLAITSASYDAAHQTLQVTVSIDAAGASTPIYLYTDNNPEPTDGAPVILASGTIPVGSSSITLTTPVTTAAALDTLLLGGVYVTEASGGFAAPTFTLGIPLNKSTFAAPVINAITETGSSTGTQSTSATISVTASAASGLTGASVTGVDIYQDTGGGFNLLGSATQSNGVWTYNATGLAPGAHTFAAVATDSLNNNTSLVAASPTVVDLVDTTGSRRQHRSNGIARRDPVFVGHAHRDRHRRRRGREVGGDFRRLKGPGRGNADQRYGE